MKVKVHIEKKINFKDYTFLIYRKTIICKINICIESMNNTRRIKLLILNLNVCNAVLGVGLLKVVWFFLEFILRAKHNET